MVVIIEECRNNGEEWISNHNTSDPNIAIERAIKKHFGQTGYFQQNNELTTDSHNRYGQIWQHGSLTTRMHIRIKN